MKVIKLSQQQIYEVSSAIDYEYLNGSPEHPYNGQSDVSADGIIDISEPGAPTTGNDVSNIITPQGYNRFGTGYRPYYYDEDDLGPLDGEDSGISEGVDKNNDNVNDYYETDQSMGALSDGKPDNNLVKIPTGVQNKTEILLKAMSGLSPKQCAIVAIKMLKDLNLSALPYDWKRYMRALIN